jgi:hypothetical protein
MSAQALRRVLRTAARAVAIGLLAWLVIVEALVAAGVRP